MSTATPQTARSGGIPNSLDFGEIIPPPGVEATERISRTHLLPEEQIASLFFDTVSPSTLTPLTNFLGPLLTVANPAWTANAIPTMRALQKTLVEHALTLAQKDRATCMAAIAVVETNVQWRLRFQQMRDDEIKMEKQTGGKANEKENKG